MLLPIQSHPLAERFPLTAQNNLSLRIWYGRSKLRTGAVQGINLLFFLKTRTNVSVFIFQIIRQGYR